MRPGRMLASGTVALLTVVTGPRAGREISFQQRVEAQRAIERVYYSHQTGATRSFETAAPDEVLEKKVRTYLKQSAALEHLWKKPVTAAALREEMERIAKQTRMPGRLEELYAALGNDPFLIQECLARPILVDRLSRGFFASEERQVTWDAWWREAGDAFDERDVPAVASVSGALPEPFIQEAHLDAGECVEEDGWDDGLKYDGPGHPNGNGSVVWTGNLMIVWGGGEIDEGSWFTPGGRYDPVTDSWTPTSDAPDRRGAHFASWTGDLMVVWGGDDPGGPLYDGLRYDPVSDTWSTIVVPESVHATSGALPLGSSILVSGYPENYRYDPVADAWTPISAPATPWSRRAVWTGQDLITLSPYDYLPSVRYNPGTDVWSPVSSIGAPYPGHWYVQVWTGHEVLVWGFWTTDGIQRIAQGGRYDPATDTWAPLSQDGAPSLEYYRSAVWSGTEMIVWGGESGTGAKYDPRTDTWSPTTTLNAPRPLHSPTLVWTGNSMLVWGSDTLVVGGDAFGTGGRYYPTFRRDDDGDGFTACEGDCNDANAAVSPAGVELPGNGLDENCDGVVLCDPAVLKNRGQLHSCIIRECRAPVAAGLLSREACRP